jgi:hypothetical protein
VNKHPLSQVKDIILAFVLGLSAWALRSCGCGRVRRRRWWRSPGWCAALNAQSLLLVPLACNTTLRFVCAAPLATTVQPPLPRAATDDVADLQGWAIVMVVLAALVVGLCLLGLAMGKYPHVALELMT